MTDFLTIEEACSEILDRRGLTPKKLGSDFTDSGYRVISAKLITEAGLELDRDNPRFVDQATYKKWMSSPLLEGDVLLTSEAPTGRVAYIKEKKEWCLGQRLFCLRPSENVSGRYLYYTLQSPKVFWELTSRGTGTTVVGIRQSSLREVTIPIPTKEDQKAIAHILGTLDDKIELNQKMNQTLEEIVKAIFKSWFVDFDPVRAKVECRDTGLPQELSDLFPNELVDSEIGEIPKGWEVRSADSLFDITIGRTPPRKESHWFSEIETDVPWVSIRDMGDCGTFISKTSEYLTHDAVSKHRIQIIPAGSVLVSFKLTVGRVCIATKDMTTNEAIAHFPPSNVFPYPTFTYFYLNGFKYESLGSTSSIATAVNSKMIKAVPILFASPNLLRNFEETVAPMIDRVRLATEEIQVLSDLRDTLLPKLISGELRIPDAEKFLEEAGI